MCHGESFFLYAIFFKFYRNILCSKISQRNLETFSKTYTVKGTLYIPYAEIREPFYAWYNGNSGSSRIDYYGGT